METNDKKLQDALIVFKAQFPTINSGDLQTFVLGWNASINKQQIKEIDKQINQFRDELSNLNENLSREFDVLDDHEVKDYEHQINLTARIIRGLNRIKLLR